MAPLALERVATRSAPAASLASDPARERAAEGIGALSTHVALLFLFALAPGSRLWGFRRLAFGRWRWRRAAGVRFCKSLGSGHEGGFGLRPSASRQGLFCVFDDEDAADAFLARSSFLHDYQARSHECLSVKLRAYSSRGTWSGMSIPVSAQSPTQGPIAAMTRASIRPGAALAFWCKAPPAEQSLAAAPGCMLAVGLGEAPLLRQATFSVWESTDVMEAYARSGAHLEAIRAAHRERYFSESMFVRFVPSGLRGVWKGRRYGSDAGALV